MFTPDLTLEKAFRFSRFDETHLLSTSSPHPIELEGETWRTAEHYYQVGVTGDEVRATRIRDADSGVHAYNINKPWYRFNKSGWRKQRRVLMTRALYIKVQMYPEVLDYLLATGDELIIETSQYDHYWGIGRDQRGTNMLGKVWMDIRQKLKDRPRSDDADK